MEKGKHAVFGLSLCAVLVSLVAAAGPVAAEDEAKPTPAERFRSVVESFPAPSAAKGFSFAGTVMLGELPVGEFRFAAEPVREGERELWKITKSIRTEVASSKVVAGDESFLEADLSAVRGRGTKNIDDVAREWSWVRRENRFLIQLTPGGDEENVAEIVEGGRHALPAVAAVLLFCRMAPKGVVADYELQHFLAAPIDGKHLRTARLRARGLGKWRGRAALLFTYGFTGQDIATIALDPMSRDILGVRIRIENDIKVELRLGRKEAEAEDQFLPPGKDPKQAALIVALAFGTNDSALLDRMTDWPSVVADLRRRYPQRKFTMEGVREQVKARLDAPGAKQNRDEMISAIRMASGQIRLSRRTKDRATVQFPEMFRKMVIKLRKFGEEWRLVVIPGT